MSSEQTTETTITRAANYRRKLIAELVLPSGDTFTVRRPSPEMVLRYGRLPHNLTAQLDAVGAGMADMDEAARAAATRAQGQQLLNRMPPAEFDAFMAFANTLVASIVVDPCVRLEPQNEDEIAPAEIEPTDFWFLWRWAMDGGRTLAPETKGGAVGVDDIEQFRADGGVSPAGAGGGQIQGEAEQAIGPA